MPGAIPYIQHSDKMVGAGHPTLSDTLNASVREILTQSGLDPDASFAGFASALDGVKSVANAAARNALYPSPTSGNRVIRKDYGTVEEHDGVTWAAILGSKRAENPVTKGADPTGAADSRQALLDTEALGRDIGLSKGTYLVSSNVTLAGVYHFERGAVLKPANGVTITITGPIIAGHFQLFDLSLGGTISFAGNRQLGRYSPVWWGADPTGTNDSSAALAKAVVSVPSASTFLSPSAANYKLTSTWVWLGVDGIRFLSGSDPRNSINPGDLAQYARFTWAGPAAGIMVAWDRCKYAEIDGWAFDSQSADYALHIDGYSTINYLGVFDGVDRGIGTQSAVRRCLFYNSGFRKTWRGINIAENTASNQEYHTIDRCNFVGWQGSANNIGLYYTTSGGTATRTGGSGPFTAGDIGKRLRIARAGANNVLTGLPGILDTTISNVVGGVATLATPASANVTNAWGITGESIGYGIYFQHANTKGIKIQYCNFAEVGVGVQMMSGSYQLDHNSWGGCEIDVYAYGATEACGEQFSHSENSRQHFASSDSGIPLSIRDSRFAVQNVTPTLGYIQLGVAVTAVMDNVTFEGTIGIADNDGYIYGGMRRIHDDQRGLLEINCTHQDVPTNRLTDGDPYYNPGFQQLGSYSSGLQGYRNFLGSTTFYTSASRDRWTPSAVRGVVVGPWPEGAQFHDVTKSAGVLGEVGGFGVSTSGSDLAGLRGKIGTRDFGHSGLEAAVQASNALHQLALDWEEGLPAQSLLPRITMGQWFTPPSAFSVDSLVGALFQPLKTAGVTQATAIETQGPNDALAFAGPIVGGVRVSKLGAPTTASVQNQGAAGSTTYGYYIVAVDANGRKSLPSALVQTTTGNATLNGTNYNTVRWHRVRGAVSYDILGRSGLTTTSIATGVVPSETTGDICTFNDQGAATAAYTAATEDKTGDSTFGGRTFQAAPATAPTDADIAAGAITFYLDEAGNNLKVRIRKSDGTYKTATVAMV